MVDRCVAPGRPAPPGGRLGPAEAHFAWVLEGRAVQDVWIMPRRGQRSGPRPLDTYGTTLRLWDPGRSLLAVEAHVPPLGLSGGTTQVVDAVLVVPAIGAVGGGLVDGQLL